MKDPHDTVTVEIERTRPTREQMLKMMAEAADDQRRVLGLPSTAATQKPREGALKRAAGVLAEQGNKEKTQ